MPEKVVSFGPVRNLVGIITEPAKSNIESALPAVIILNAGLVHKVGPYRLTVDLAREIAGNGFYVMRFDLSGLGDSKMGPKIKKLNRWDMALRDVNEAMTLLSKRYGLNKFILIGLCSGSDNSHYISLMDERVVGTVHFDGFSFKNAKYYIYFYGPRLLSINSIQRIVIDLLTPLLKKINKSIVKKQLASVELASVNRSFPSKKQAEVDFRSLISRGVKLFYIYNGMGQSYNSYKNQLRDSLKKVNFKNCLELEYYPYAQHTYETISSRKRVVKRVSDWVGRNFN